MMSWSAAAAHCSPCCCCPARFRSSCHERLSCLLYAVFGLAPPSAEFACKQNCAPAKSATQSHGQSCGLLHQVLYFLLAGAYEWNCANIGRDHAQILHAKHLLWYAVNLSESFAHRQEAVAFCAETWRQRRLMVSANGWALMRRW